MAIDYISNANIRGKENFRADYSLEDNPYQQDSNDFNEWRNGYLTAQSEQ